MSKGISKKEWLRGELRWYEEWLQELFRNAFKVYYAKEKNIKQKEANA